MPAKQARRGKPTVTPIKLRRRHTRTSPTRRVLPDRPPVQGLAENITLYVNVDGRPVPLPHEVLQELETVELHRSIELGSTLKLTTLDPHRNLQHAGYFKRVPGKEEDVIRSDFLFDDLWFRCCNFEKLADEFKLTAEDREIAMMRRFHGPASSSAAQGSKNPRAIWIQKLLTASGLNPHTQFYCPEIGKKPAVVVPIETAHSKKKSKARGGSKKSMTVEGVGLDPDQRHNVEILMSVCDEKHAPRLARVAIICAAIGESTLRTITTPNSLGYWGVLQGASGQKGSAPNFTTVPNPQVTKEMAQSFLDGGRGFQANGALHLIKSGVTDPGVIATEVEKSGEPGSYYGKHAKEAEALIDASGGEEPGGSGAAEANSYVPQRSFKLPYNEKSQGEEPEGAWENGEHYANEVNWRLFCMSGRVTFVSDEHLEHQVPAVEGLDESTEGVVDIKWQIDARKRVNVPTLEIDARCPLWFAPPGSSIVMGDRNGTELHEGVWLVADINRPDVLDNAVTITLVRPKSPLPEKAEARKTRPVSSVTPGAPSGTPTRDGGHNPGPTQPVNEEGVPRTAQEVYWNAYYISKLGLPYIYGGGHGATFGPTPALNLEGGQLPTFISSHAKPSGLDCSSAVSWALGGGSANLLSHPYDSVGLEFWGAAGIGKYFTVWCRSRPDGHVFLEFTPALTGGAPKVFVYHGVGAHNGFDHESHDPSTGNWKPRHWPNN